MQARKAKTLRYLCYGTALASLLYLLICCNSRSTGSNELASPLGTARRLNVPGDESAFNRTGEPPIRVLLAEAASRVSVAVAGPFEIRQGHKMLQHGRRLPKTTITPAVGRPPGLLIGRLSCDPGKITILPKNPGSLKLYFYAENNREIGRQYDGYVIMTAKPAAQPPRTDSVGNADSVLSRSNMIEVVNVVGLDHYLVAVLDAELYPRFHIETYRAQAIAARTYALYEKHTVGQNRAYDLCATERSQVYKGRGGVDRNSKAWRAITDTQGIVCTWSSPVGEKIFCAYYSAACGGVTQNVSNWLNAPTIPPLAGGVRCTYCNIAGRVYRWEPLRISKTEVTERLQLRYPQYATLGQILTISIIDITPDGRPLNLRIAWPGGRSVELNSYAFRMAMGGHLLLSNHCNIVDRGTHFEFTEGRGFGHGVGLCQWGAEGQARLGRKASQILAFYYPTSHLTRTY